VKREVERSMAGYGMKEMEIRARMPQYIVAAKNKEPHRLSCDDPGYNAKAATETLDVWKFDSEIALFGEKDGNEVTDTFLGCFQPDKIPDTGGAMFCWPIGMGFEMCYDPLLNPFNCCATDKELLAAGTLDGGFGALALFVPQLWGFMFGEGCNVPRDRDNAGYRLDFWWPENEVEIHNYERAIFNPLFECGNQKYQHFPLTQFLQNFAAKLTQFVPAGNKILPGAIVEHRSTPSDAGIPKALRMDPHIGESHWAGILPGDQTFVAEAHVYRTYVNALSAINSGGQSTQLGYKRDCRCFHSGLQSNIIDSGPGQGRARKIVNGWTEYNRYLPYWRTYQYSQMLSPLKYEALEKFNDIHEDTCASLRAFEDSLGARGRMGNKYQDLAYALGAIPPNPESGPLKRARRLRNELFRICYIGGGDLFPITGQLIGHFSTLPASAYVARRALYLFGKDRIWRDKNNLGDEFVPPEERINKFSDNDDKMQRIYPLVQDKYASKCFRTQEIPNYLQEGNFSWPRDLISDAKNEGDAGPKDSPRFLYWSKRKSCMCPYVGEALGLRYQGSPFFLSCIRATDACRKKEEGDYEDNEAAPLGGFNPGHAPPSEIPDGIPFPFMPKYGVAEYMTDPIEPSDPSVFQRPGAPRMEPGLCELTERREKPLNVNTRIPEWTTNLGGLKCQQQLPRCDRPAPIPPD